MVNYKHNTLQIDKLHLTGNAVSKARYLSQLQQTNWPVAASQRWYFINHMHVTSSNQEMAASLSTQTQQLLNQAVNIADNRNAHYQNCIYFDNQLQMLTCLSIDIHFNQAARLWYWQQWRYLFIGANSEQLTSLWQEHIVYLPSLINGFAGSSLLTAIWSSLSDAQHQALLSCYCHHLGISLHDINESLAQSKHFSSSKNDDISHSQLITHKDDMVTPLLSAQNVDLSSSQFKSSAKSKDNIHFKSKKTGSHAITLQQINTASDINTIPETLLAPWHDIFTAYFRSISNNQVHIQPASLTLASLLILIQWKPALIGFHVHELGYYINLISHSFAENLTHHPLDSEKPTITVSYETNSSAQIAAHQSGIKQSDINDSEKTTLKQNIAPETTINNSIPITNDKGFMTNSGGLFYLINIINHPETIAILNKHKDFQEAFSGWKLLFQLGLHLFPGRFNVKNYDASLTDFFAELCCIPYQKAEQSLLLPDFSQLCCEIESLMMEHDSIKPLWNKQLLSKKALLCCTQSHVDIYFSEQEIDIRIRLAALDINPGWVSCLGRVVSFHYQHNDDFNQSLSASRGSLLI